MYTLYRRFYQFSFLVITPWPNFQWSATASICSRTFPGLWGTYCHLCCQTRNAWEKMPSRNGHQPMSVRRWWTNKYSCFLTPHMDNTEVCIPCCFPEVSSGTEFWSPTVVSCLIHSVLAAFLPCLTFHPHPRSPGITPEIIKLLSLA